MFCKKCGQQLRADAVFCPNCGTKVIVNSKAGKSAKPSAQMKPLKLFAGAIALILVAGGSILCVKAALSGKEKPAGNDPDKELQAELSSDEEMENLWKELEKDSEDAAEAEAAFEKADKMVEASEELIVDEVVEPGYMNPDIARVFGLTRDEVIALLGEPDQEFEKTDVFWGELSYGDIRYQIMGESDVVNRIGGPLNKLISEEQVCNTVDDMIAMTGAEGLVDYYVDEGVGDYSFGRGELVSKGYTQPYYFEMAYNPDRSIDADSWIAINYDEDRTSKMSYASNRPSGDQVEERVSEIRERYNSTVQSCNAGNEISVDVEIDGEVCRVTANLDEYGNVMRVVYQKNGSTFWLYYYDVNLDFLYAELADGSAERWYFSGDKAFRVRVSADAGKPDESYNYENDELLDILKSEDNTDSDIKWMETAAFLRRLFVEE